MTANSEILNYIKKSFELKNQSFYKPAIEMLYKALALAPDNIEILAQLALNYKLLGNFERTIYYTDKVFELAPNHVDCLFLLEEVYIAQNDLAKAIEISNKIYEIQPIPQNLAKKINILNKLGDIDAIKAISESIQDFNDQVLYELACGFYKVSDYKKAQELLELAICKNPESENVKLLLAKIYYEQKEFKKSKDIFIELEKTSKSDEVMNYLGLFCLNEQNLLKAIAYFERAIKLNRKNPEYAYNIASAYFLNGWLDEALKFFNQAICLDSNNIEYHFSLAYLYYQKQSYDKAQMEIDFIKKLDENHQLSNILAALIKAKNGDLLNAKEQLEALTENNQADDFAYSALSKVYKDLSQYDLAKKSIEKALETKPKSLEYLSELLDIELEQKQFDNAEKTIKNILAINENYLYAYTSLARISLEQGNYERVFDAAQDIIELDSSCADGYYYNAIALFEQGDKDFAIESLKKSISLDVNNSKLYAKMSEFYQELGDFKNAFEWAKEANLIDDRNYKYKWLCARLAAVLHNEDDAVKYYSKGYRLAAYDKDLCNDYAKYLKLIGREKQAKNILKI